MVETPFQDHTSSKLANYFLFQLVVLEIFYNFNSDCLWNLDWSNKADWLWFVLLILDSISDDINPHSPHNMYFDSHNNANLSLYWVKLANLKKNCKMRAGWGHEVGCLFCFCFQFFLLFSDFRFQFSALTIVNCRSQRRGNLGMVYRMTPVFWFVIFISAFINLFGIGYCWVQISVERRIEHDV